MDRHSVFITGGSGYMGRPLIADLTKRGHTVRALVREGSQSKLPAGCEPVIGNALDGATFATKISPADTFVHLVGVAHPSPAKAAQFRSIDLVAATNSIRAASQAGIQHFVYLSVAQPAPMMKVYVQVRAECEALLGESGMNATMLRPWYVLGPGHRWPYALIPAYWLMEQIPATREGARRLGLVTLEQMKSALLNSIENPCQGTRVIDVPQIRASLAPA